MDDADRQPAHRPKAHRPDLRPATEEEQGVDDVARQEVAVDGLETGPPGILDAAIGDLDRLRPPIDEVEHRRQVRPRPEQRVGVVELEGGLLGLAKQLDRGRRVAPPRERHRERRRRVNLLAARRRVARPSDLDRLARQPLGVREDPVEHLQLGEAGQHGRAFRTRLARDELDRTSGRQHRSGRVAAGPPDLGEAFVEQAEADAVATGIEPSDGRLEERRRPRDPPDREGGLGRADLEIDPVGRRRGPAARARPAPDPRAATGPLERVELVGRGVAFGGERRPPRSRRIERRAGRGPPASATRPRTAARRAPRRGRRGSASGDRQQVARDGAPDRLMTERQRPVDLDHEAAVERLRPAGPQVGIEAAGTGPRAGHGARRRAVALGVEGHRDARQLLGRERALGQRHQPQDPPALARADRQPGDDQVVERPAERRRGQLPASGEQLLGHERQAARPLGDEQQQAGRRPFLLDAFDQGGQLVAIERRQHDPIRRPRAAHDGVEVGHPGVVARDGVELVRPDDGQALVARDPGQERDERPGRGVGAVEVLEHEDDRPPLPEPPEQTQDPLEGPCLPPFRGRPAAAPRHRAGHVEDGRELRQETHDLGRRGSEQVGQLVDRQSARRVGPMARTIGPYGSSARAGHAVARRTVIGSPSACIRAMTSSMKRVTPTPAVPSSRIVRVRPPAASSSPAARRANASSRPTKRALE